MSTKHTPGPWREQREIQGGRVIYRVYRVHGEFASPAECHPHTVPNEGVQQANARLIAAAPDMLEALLRIADDGCSRCDADEEHMQNGEECDNHGDQLRAVARAAIAKAEGTTA